MFGSTFEPSGGGLDDAPIDGNYYVRQNGVWVIAPIPTPPVVKQILYSGGLGQTVAAGATMYLNLVSPMTGFVAAVGRNIVIPTSGKLLNLYVLSQTNQPASGALNINLLVNNTPTALLITIPANGAPATRSNLVNQLTINPADTATLRFINGAAAASAQIINVSVEFNF